MKKLAIKTTIKRIMNIILKIIIQKKCKKGERNNKKQAYMRILYSQRISTQ